VTRHWSSIAFDAIPGSLQLQVAKNAEAMAAHRGWGRWEMAYGTPPTAYHFYSIARPPCPLDEWLDNDTLNAIPVSQHDVGNQNDDRTIKAEQVMVINGFKGLLYLLFGKIKETLRYLKGKLIGIAGSGDIDYDRYLDMCILYGGIRVKERESDSSDSDSWSVGSDLLVHLYVDKKMSQNPAL